MEESRYQVQSALEPSYAPSGTPNSTYRGTKVPDPWRDPLGLGADPGTIMGTRYRAAKYYLGRYLDKDCGSDSPDQSQELTGTGAAPEAVTNEIVIKDIDDKDAHFHKMKLAARRDLLKMNLVILDDILMEFQLKSKHAASRGFGTFVMVNFLYQCGRYPASPKALDYILLAFATLSTGYALTTGSTLGLVMWCSRRAKLVREKLNTERLSIRDRNALDGWWWGTLEWVAGFNVGPFMYLFWPGRQ